MTPTSNCTPTDTDNSDNFFPDLEQTVTLLYPDANTSTSHHAKHTLLDFLKKCLTVHPAQRWTAEALLQHPFLTMDIAVEPLFQTTGSIGLSAADQKAMECLFPTFGDTMNSHLQQACTHT
eukprot:TRINITY_DN15727_c0_g1_i1.p1 TRINITY_DN15727_c0_g1~~TRINITY_DN15727_c0_g1_i1.p1  ORF type:complete len:121 (-),score=10.71 TRINITY_DN15727_c0_g1_i1:94-456(-)